MFRYVQIVNIAEETDLCWQNRQTIETNIYKSRHLLTTHTNRKLIQTHNVRKRVLPNSDGKARNSFLAALLLQRVRKPPY